MTTDHDDPAAVAPRLILGRREVLALLGSSAGAAFLASYLPGTLRQRGVPASGAAAGWLAPASAVAADTPACIVRPEQTEGPYFVDERLNRSDIRSDPSEGSVRDGVPLTLTFNVGRIDGDACTALPNVLVDVWHCDAAGVYSDVTGSVGTKFLRGYQVTDANGDATFVTIYPGWYTGRTVHIHFKIRTDPDDAQGFEFTSQLYFDDDLTDAIAAQQPYAAEGTRTTRNANDGIFANDGDELLLAPTADGQGGYAASFAIGLDIGTSTTTTTIPGSGCATTASCLAALAATLPDPAAATGRKARRKARRLAHWNAIVASAVTKAEASSGARRTRQYARARNALAKLVAVAEAADAAELLGVALVPIQTAAAGVLGLIPD